MSDDGYIRIRADIDEAMEFFENLDVNKAKIQRYILKSVGQGALSHVKKTMNSVVKNKTGLLKRTLVYKLKSDRTVVVSSNAENEKKVRYGHVLAYGWKAPKAVDNSNYFSYLSKLEKYGKVYGRPAAFKEQKTGLMTFKIGDKWIRTYHTEGQPRDFLEGPVERWTGSTDFHNRVDKALQKQVDYWEKRIKAGK